MTARALVSVSIGSIIRPAANGSGTSREHTTVKAKKILLPIDFSPSSDEAVDAASMLAKGAGGEILIVYVEELPIHEDSGYLYRVPPPDTEESLARLKEVVPTEKVPYQHRVLKGPVTE